MTGSEEEIQKRLEKAVRLIKYTDIAFKDIAKDVGYNSLSALSLAVTRRYGMSSLKLRRQHDNRNLRAELAQFLIQNTQLKGDEIANNTCYNSRGHLAMDFKRHTGQSISEFRKQNLPYSVLKARNSMVESSRRLHPIAQKTNFFGDYILIKHFEKHSQKAAELGIEEYRNHLKVWRAERLLRRTDKDEEFIAGAVGFADVEDFRTFFKEETKTKVLPLDYRKQAANDANLPKPQPQVA